MQASNVIGVDRLNSDTLIVSTLCFKFVSAKFQFCFLAKAPSNRKEFAGKLRT